MLVALAVLALTTTVPVSHAGAARAFGGARFSQNVPGDIVYVANTLLTCSPSPNCTATQNGTRVGSNNEFSMTPVDVDGDGSTTNSSSATLAIPAGSTVLFAGLYWGAVSNSGSRNQVLFEAGAGAGYTPITADILDNNGQTYQGFADVTTLVQAAGNDVYTVGGVRLRTGSGRHAGWSLVVAYENADEPWRSLTVFDGFELVNRGNPIDIVASGFVAPPVGPVEARIGMIAYEGDTGYTGDYAEFEGTRLGDGLNPTNNFFTSMISDGGALVPGMSPGYVDQLGYDAKIIETSGVVAPSATSATISLRSNGDWYYPGVVTSAIEIFVPNVSAEFDKTVTDIDGGQVLPGDTLEYEITLSNQGGDGANDFVLTDAIPAGTTFVPGSLEIVEGDNPGPKSDTPSDQAFESGGTVTFHLGVGATGSSGGSVGPFALTGQRYRMRFQVTVDGTVAAGTDITNVAEANFTAQTTGDSFSTSSEPATVTVAALADLSFTSKTDNVDPVLAGDPVVWTLAVQNDGPSPAADVVITDTLPPGATFDPGSSTAGCSATGSVVSCALGTLGLGAATVSIGATVDPTAAAGTVTNSASVSTSTADVDPTDNAGSETTTIARQVDLSATKVATPSPALSGDAVAGGTVSYALTIANAGPSTATNAVLTENLPTGTSLVSAVPSGTGSCVDNGASVECSWASLDAGTSETVTVVVNVDPSVADGTTIVNTVSTSSDDPEAPAGAPDGATASVDVARRIDLQTTKSLTVAPTAGAVASYAIAVTNVGESDASNVVVTDTLPAGSTFVPAQSSGACTLSTATTVECVVATLALGATANFTVAVVVDAAAAAGSPVVNQASATADEFEDAATLADNTASDSSAAARSSDLVIAKNHVSEPVTAGGPVTYTIDIENRGPSDAANVVVTDTLPSGVSFAASPGCTEPSPGTVECSAASLAVGASTSFTINGTVSPLAVDGEVLTNVAEVTSDSPDVNSANNQATVTTQVERLAFLDIFKREAAGSVDPVLAGETVVWEIEVVNRGPSIASDVVISDDMSALPVTVGAVTGPGCGVASGVVTCSQAALAVGDSIIVTVEATVDSSVADGTQIVNQATASGAASPQVSAVEETTVLTSVDLNLTKTGPANLLAGATATYTLTLTNDGPSDATGVTVADILPTEFAFDAFRVMSGSATCAPVAGNLECSVGTLAAGDSIVLEIDAVADTSMSVGDVAENRAVADGDQPDPDPGSNTPVASTTIGRASGLSITKVDPIGTTVAGGSIVYDLTVTNAGPSDASAVQVTDPVPPGTTFDPALSDPNCAEAGGLITCSLGVLDPDAAPVQFTIALTVDAGFGVGTITNEATVSGAETDPVSTDDTAQATTTVDAEADLSIVKTSPATAPVPGANYTYTVTVANAGPSDATAVTVVDELPAGTSLVSTSLGAGCSESAGDVTCDLGTIADGAAASVTITIAVPADQLAELVNTATVSSTATDPIPSDNTAVDRSAVLASADLATTKAAVAATVVAGAGAAFVIEVANLGPSDAPGLLVSDQLAPTLTFDPSGSDPRCSDIGGGEIHCLEPGPLAPGAPVESFVIAVTTAASLAEGAAVANTAWASSQVADPDGTNNSGRADLAITREADLAVAKSADQPEVAAGSTVTYTVTATNNGPSDATDAIITDTLPVGLTLVAATPGPGLTCSTTASSAMCTASTLALGASATLEIVASVAPDLADASTVTNSASVSAAENDTVPGNDSATADVLIRRDVNLGITKSASASPTAVAGASETFEIVVQNTGLSDASNVVVTDPLPAGTTFDAAASAANCSESGGVITCTVGTLPAGQTSAFVLSVLVDPGAADGSTLTNTATVASDESDTNPLDDSSTMSVPVERRADLYVHKEGSALPVVAGTATSFVFTVGNIGPSDATGVEIADTLPAGLTFDPGASDPRCSAVGADVTCLIGDIAFGDPSQAVTIGVTVDAGLADGTTLDNTAAAGGNEIDREPANDTSTTSIQVVRTSALELVKTDLADPVLAGTSLTYELAATNQGPSAAAGVVIVDTLPAGTVIGALPAGCVASAATEVTCSPGALADGETATYTLTVGLDPSIAHATQAVNNAVVSAATAPSVTTSEETTIERVIDLSVAKSVTPSTIVAGSPVVYELVVTNAGPSLATNIVLNDILPASSTVGTITAGTASCAESIGQVSCLWPSLAPGSSETVSIEVIPESFLAAGVPFENGATVSADEAEAITDNNATVDSGVIDRTVDVSLTKVVDSPATQAGADLAWTLTATNNGPSFSADVVITDPLPAGTTFDADRSSVECTAVGQEVTCALGQLADGASTSVVIAVNVDPSLDEGTLLVNTASVATPEPNLAADPTATSTVEVGTGADLVLLKEIVSETVGAGGQVAFELTVSNLGPSDARDVQILDELVADLTLDVEATDDRCVVADPLLECSLGVVAVGESVTVLVVGTLDPGASGQLDNTATVVSNTVDPDPDSNTATVSAVIERVADLSITKATDSTGEVAVGDTVVWTIEVTNAGPATATDVVVLDALPAGLALVPTPACATAEQGIECDLADLGVGQSVQLVIETTVTAAAEGSITNVATVSSAETDPNAADDVGTADISIEGAGLAVSGRNLTYVAAIGMLLVVAGFGAWSAASLAGRASA